MSQPLVYILLLFALLLPVLGAVLLRVLAPRLLPRQLYYLAAGIFCVAILSTLVLARSEVPSVQIGRLSLLLPVSPPDEPAPAPEVVARPTDPAAPVPTAAPSATALPSATPAPSATPEPIATPTPEPPTATPTLEPTATPAAAPGGQRRYTVQPGDTLRSIAEQFNVSVQAIIETNRLTPAQADSLRVGQELIIP